MTGTPSRPLTPAQAETIWHTCGQPGCRVCRVLKRWSRPPARSSAKHHPLTTEKALARLDAVHAALLVRPRATLAELAAAVGLKSGGLVALYMQRLEAEGRARRVRVPGAAGGRSTRWEAIERCSGQRCP